MDDRLKAARAEVQRIEQEARQLRADAEAVQRRHVEAGITAEMMLASKDGEESDPAAKAFLEIDAAHKLADTKKVEAEHARERLNSMYEWSGRSQAEITEAAPAGSNRARRFSERFAASDSYKRLSESGALQSEQMLMQAVAGGVMPVEVLSRDEMDALLSSARYGATTVTGGSATSGGPFIQNDLQAGFVEYRRKRPLLSALVGQGTTDSDVVEYVSQSAPTDAAAETAEDSAAPESTYAFATNTVDVRDITHFVPITNRAMADHGQLRTIIENELTMGALDRLDTQIASGNGTPPNIQGIYTATTQTQALGGLTRSEAIHKAITAIRVAAGVLSEPDNVGMHPADYEDLILEQDANLQYIFGPPSQGAARSVWGIPIVTSTVFTSGTPLVGDYQGSARLWMREGLMVSAGLNATDFVQRRITLLASLRCAFVVTRAGGFCEVTGF